MRIVTATGCFWYRPFEQVLEIIKAAGGRYIEADLYWTRDRWERGQHLKNVSPRDGLEMIRNAGLIPSNVHNVGGLSMRTDEPAAEVFDKDVFGWLESELPEKCLVFHAPHIMMDTPQPQWWEVFEDDWVATINTYRRPDTIVTMENLQPVPGCYFPVFTVDALESFVERHDLQLTFDTTQALWAGFDLYDAAERLSPHIVNCHLSEFTNRVPHSFIGEGDIDWPRFFGCLDVDSLFSVTIECTMSTPDTTDREMSDEELVDRLGLAIERIEKAVVG